MFDPFLRQTFIVVLIVSAIPLIASSVVGFFVSILQAATQVQDQTLSYVLKVGTSVLTLYLFSDWLMFQVLQLFQDFFRGLAFIGKI